MPIQSTVQSFFATGFLFTRTSHFTGSRIAGADIADMIHIGSAISFIFTVQHGQGAYIEKINRMRENNKHRLLVDLNDLRQYDGDLTRRCDLRASLLIIPSHLCPDLGLLCG